MKFTLTQEESSSIISAHIAKSMKMEIIGTPVFSARVNAEGQAEFLGVDVEAKPLVKERKKKDKSVAPVEPEVVPGQVAIEEVAPAQPEAEAVTTEEVEEKSKKSAKSK